jgi:SAM-dependent methyltransferase
LPVSRRARTSPSPGGTPEDGAPRIFLRQMETFADHAAFLHREANTLALQRRFEHRLMEQHRGEFIVEGRCWVCDGERGFLVDYLHADEQTPDGRPVPNWRERLVCPRCGLNNRLRATVHLIESIGGLTRDSALYVTEQIGPIYTCFARRFLACSGSEWLADGTAPGCGNAQGIRHEDVTALTFDNASFDAVISLDVFEHVPDFQAGFAECHRVLKPYGKLFVTVPFRCDWERNLVRARVRADGSIEHLLEPEYHGNPAAPAGILAYYRFGWQVLDQMRGAGFGRATAYLYWSRDWGYLGESQTLLVAEKHRSRGAPRHLRAAYDKTLRRAWRRLNRTLLVRRLPRAPLDAGEEAAGSTPRLFL